MRVKYSRKAETPLAMLIIIKYIFKNVCFNVTMFFLSVIQKIIRFPAILLKVAILCEAVIAEVTETSG